jgi:hypothetical protein
VLLLLGLLAASNADSQVQDRSPSDLVRFLTYQSGRYKKPMLGLVSSLCRIDQDGLEDRAAAKSLIGFGAVSVPPIEDVFDALDKGRRETDLGLNFGWLVYAYARIKGPAAYPRLWRMAAKPEFEDFQVTLDDSIALAFGLTSYVSSFRRPMAIIHCRPPQPREALDHLILAWERGDRSWLEAHLGPQGKAALASLLQSRNWAQMRAELWTTPSGVGVAVGYRFEIPNEWSEPQMLLEDLNAVSEDKPEIRTRFKSGSGAECGAENVRFVRTPGEAGGALPGYLVDNSDLAGLLRRIASCAASQ